MNDDLFDDLIRTKIREQESLYPAHLPAPDELWRSLNERRSHDRAERKRRVWSMAAAVLVLIMGGYAFLFYNNSSGDTVRMPATLSSKEQNAVNFIARYCAEANVSCSTPVIRELRSDLEQSFRKLEEIDQKLQVYSDDVELIRAKARIESHQARLIKTIVQTL